MQRPLQNRVLPDGSIVATQARGTMMGNRGGAFHTPSQTLFIKHWHSRQWICCVLEFKNRRRQVMQPRRYTELFFLDEATALSAGHRPCFECRRVAALDFATRWNNCRGETGRARADHMDRILHAERLDENGAKRTYRAPIDTLPDNAFFHHRAGVARIAGRYIQVWSLGGYGRHLPRPKGIEVEVLTPRSTVVVLGAGYMPVFHTSATS
jgi:hypothetical protein